MRVTHPHEGVLVEQDLRVSSSVFKIGQAWRATHHIAPAFKDSMSGGQARQTTSDNDDFGVGHDDALDKPRRE